MIKIREVLKYLDEKGEEYSFEGDVDILISGFSSLSRYKEGNITWVKKQENINLCKDINDVKIAVIQEGIEVSIQNKIITKDSKRVFFGIIENFFNSAKERPLIGNGTYVGDNVKIGKNVHIGHNCTIDGNIEIGDNVEIYNNVCIINRAYIGDNCTIHSGVIIGHDDYSYTEDNNHNKTMIKHYGGVLIENDVFIGAGCVINRGTIDNTIIRSGCKIDAQCHISHNCVIGYNSSIISGSRIYGSVVTGTNAYVATSIIKNQLSIGENSVIGMGSVVLKDVDEDITVVGIPAKKLIR